MAVAFYVAFTALWLLVIFNTLVTIGLVRKVAEGRPPPPRPAGVPSASGGSLRGKPMPDFLVDDIHENMIESATLSNAALLFVSPDCSTCGVTLDELEALRTRMEGRVVVICRATKERCTELARQYSLEVPVVADSHDYLTGMFGVEGTPTAVLIEEDGTVGTYGHPMSVEDLERQLVAGPRQEDTE